MRSRLRAFLALLRKEHATPGQLAAAVFVGLFFGIVPFYGIQIPLCLLVATVFRLNRLVVFGAVQVSNPLFAPFLLAAGVMIGEWIRYGRLHAFDLAATASLFDGGTALDLYLSCLLGDTLLAFPLGGLGAWATYAWRVRADARTASAGPGGEVLGDRPE